SLRPVEWIAVRLLAADLYAVAAKFFCGANEFGQSEGFAAIPATEVSDAIESNFHSGFDRGCFSAAHTIALRKMVFNASFSKSHGPCPMKIHFKATFLAALLQPLFGRLREVNVMAC